MRRGPGSGHKRGWGRDEEEEEVGKGKWKMHVFQCGGRFSKYLCVALEGWVHLR